MGPRLEFPEFEALAKLADDPDSPFFPLIQATSGHRVRMDGTDVVTFGSCDYLGLSQHPQVKERAVAAIDAFGTNTHGAQVLCGRTVLHDAVERHLARVHGKERALLFPSGMTANIAVISTLAGPGDTVINDRSNHVSLLMGSRLSGARVRTFLHNDMDRLERLLAACRSSRRRIIAVDGLFSADGDFAPLDRIVELADEYNALVVVDEAHSFGVVGPRGLGVADHFGVLDRVDVVVGTMSKAVGSVGGFVVSDAGVHDALRALAPFYSNSRGAPPAVVGAALAALELIENEGEKLRADLNRNVEHITSTLRFLGFDLLDTCSHVVPLCVGAEEETLVLARRLRDQGVFLAPFIHPAVPKKRARLRIGVTATHTAEQCEMLFQALDSLPPESFGRGRSVNRVTSRQQRQWRLAAPGA
ncbi:aminotransferase class I/II-fold pyridoxal phosphate-dependent enzyme [Streptomyces sp. NPDC052676]|uniref:aminotransferase class I/II-fold pyridoxal phosphate-dependent enzyme n=1 Tax=Streptomyces sp. NPDC052676 TaxID=3154953 RepID=UPI0034168DD2